MGFFRLLRKLPGMDAVVRQLAEMQQASAAGDGIEDITLFSQNRVDNDHLSYEQSSEQKLDGDLSDLDIVHYVGADAGVLMESGEFGADGDFFCGSGYVPEVDKPEGAFASGPGNFNEPGQPAVADFSDLG